MCGLQDALFIAYVLGEVTQEAQNRGTITNISLLWSHGRA
jgi:hypothetical protein